MKQTRITIKDIAKEFGVAVSTVSRALHNSNEVSDELKKNICDYAAARVCATAGLSAPRPLA